MTLRRADVARLVLLALIWSGSFALLRVLSPALGPAWVATLRLLVGGGALAGWLAWSGAGADLRRRWRTYAFVGAVNCALPFALFAWAALHLPASYLVILNATTPLMAAVLAVPFLRERLDAFKVAGLVAGIGGVALVTRAVPLAADPLLAYAVAAGLGAALCYAAAGIWLKRHATGVSPPALGAWSQLFAGAALLPFAAPSTVHGPVDARVIVDLLVLGLVCSGVAYLLYYRLVRDVGPTRALTVTFLMPAFGMLWGWMLLGETITPGMLGGAALVLAGTSAVLHRRPERRHGVERVAA